MGDGWGGEGAYFWGGEVGLFWGGEEGGGGGVKGLREENGTVWVWVWIASWRGGGMGLGRSDGEAEKNLFYRESKGSSVGECR